MASSNPGSEKEMDYEQHDRSYRLFMRLTKGGIVVVTTILILMAIFLL